MSPSRWSRRALALLLALVPAGCAADGGGGSMLGVSAAPIIDGYPGSAALTMGTVSVVWERAILETAGCSGTLIAPRVVLTAAHCVVEEARTAAPGELLVTAGAPFRSAATPAQLYAVERVHPHPGFPAGEVDDAMTGLGRDDDIAVLVLARDVDTVPVSRILDPALAALHVARGRWVRIAGYGVTDTMFPAGTLFWADATLAARSDHEILVGGTGMPDTCYGDSGGPTFLLVGAEWALIGVTSRARLDRTTACGDGSIDTLAPAYLDWIAEVSSGAYSLDAGPGLDAGPRPDTGPSTPGRWRACGCAVPARSRSLDATFVTSALFLLALARRAARSLPEPSPPRRGAARGR